MFQDWDVAGGHLRDPKQSTTHMSILSHKSHGHVVGHHKAALEPADTEQWAGSALQSAGGMEQRL